MTQTIHHISFKDVDVKLNSAPRFSIGALPWAWSPAFTNLLDHIMSEISFYILTSFAAWCHGSSPWTTSIMLDGYPWLYAHCWHCSRPIPLCIASSWKAKFVTCIPTSTNGSVYEQTNRIIMGENGVVGFTEMLQPWKDGCWQGQRFQWQWMNSKHQNTFNQAP